MNVGVLIVATNKYIQFVAPLVSSIQNNFLVEHDVTCFVFTDQDMPSSSHVRAFSTHHEPWPMMTLKRYHIFLDHVKDLQSQDYLFYLDADMRIEGKVGDEVLSSLTAVKHPGFYAKHPNEFTYERRPESTAYVPFNKGQTYYCGGFNGGLTSCFLTMAREIRGAVDQDLANNLIAVWHDESHLNRYLVANPPACELSPSYCFPEGWDGNFTPKVIALNKDHDQMRGS